MTARRLASVALMAAALLAGCATGGPAGDVADLGRGIPQGETCEARRDFDGAAARALTATDLYAAAWVLRCRGWTDTEWIGAIYAVRDTPAARAALDAARAAHMACGAPGALPVAGIGRVEARRCDTRYGLPGLALAQAQGGTLYAAFGLDRFAANLAGGLQLAAGRPVRIASTAPDLSALPPAPGGSAAATAAGDADPSLLRQDVRSYNTRGQYVDAREVASSYASRIPAEASPTDVIELNLEAALAESNLDYPQAATTYIDRAEALLDGPAAPTGAQRELLITKITVYRALEALNRGQFTTALRLADAALARAGAPGAPPPDPLSDPATLRAVNNRGAAADAAASAAIPTAVLRAQALYVRGVSLLKTGRADDADAALVEAADTLDAAEAAARELNWSNVQWLRSSIDNARAQIAVARGDRTAARQLFASSVARLEAAPLNRDSPLMAQRLIDNAGFLRSIGDIEAARAQYDAAVAILRAAGPSSAGSVVGLSGYFALLDGLSRYGGADAGAARAAFFETSQLVNPPALSAQIAQLNKVFESGGSDAAVKAKALQDLDRERRGLATQLASAGTASADRARLAEQLGRVETQIAEVRRELAGDQRYLQANDSIVTLAELQAQLRPNEAYLKLLALSDANYVQFITRDAIAVRAIGLAPAAYTALVKRVRSSIDGTRTRSGAIIAVDFDVDGAAALYGELLAPFGPPPGVTHLIVDAAGAMATLPAGVLVTDTASAERYAVTSRTRASDYSNVDFLAAAVDLSTTVSPRAFLTTRALAPSRAGVPYIGFGHHAVPTAAELAALPSRGVFAGGCGTQAGAVEAAYAALRPIAATELSEAARLLGSGSQTVVGADFTDTAIIDHVDPAAPRIPGEGAVRGNYRGFQVLHFATHGLVEGALGCDSPPALLTSIGPAPSDGLLSFEEIARLNLDANLVVLSACDTAESTSDARSRRSGFRAGLAGQGATLNGLVRAFLVAGSRAVLTTHWSIPESVTVRPGKKIAISTPLMVTMFGAAKTATISGAVRAGQLSLITDPDTSHPLYWGAFAVVGDGSKSMLSGTPVSAARPM